MKKLLLLLALLACSPPSDDALADAGPVCEAPRRIAELPAELKEASGLAVSRRNPGILWVHGDSGDMLFALDTLGNLRARITVRRVHAEDWEDIAIGDCAGGSCLYLGAIGDNRQNSPDRAIFEIPEPSIADSIAIPTRSFRYRFPDGSHDTEALFVIGRQLYLITKGRSGPITLYAFPAQSTGDVATLRRVQSLTTGLVQLPDMVTAAAATPDGKVVLVRTYSAFQLYSFADEQLEPLSTHSGYDLQQLQEFQGEGADITATGTIYLVSEKGLSDDLPPLSKVVCDLSSY